MSIFKALGLRWDRTVVPEAPSHSVERACFRMHKSLPEFVWDAGVLEGNPFTYPEVQTLLEGITVGGRKLSDQEQILNIAAGTQRLLDLVKHREFLLSKDVFTELNGLVACNEALESGWFRGEGSEVILTPDVALGAEGRYTPPATEPGAPVLNGLFQEGIQALESQVANPLERGMAFFLFGALQQFFFDGNKRTSRLMMNGILMSSGIDAISVPAARVQEFNTKMVRFYLTRDATEMMDFLVSCHPEPMQRNGLVPNT